VGWLALAGAWVVWDYFGTYRQVPDLPLAFDDEKAALALYAQGLDSSGSDVYLSPALASHPTVRVLTAESTRGFYPAYGLVLPPASSNTADYLYLAGEVETISELEDRLEAAGLVYSVEGLAAEGVTGVDHDLTAVRVPPSTEREDFRRAAGREMVFGDTIRLVGARVPPVVKPGEVLTVTLLWEALTPTATDLNTAIHVVTLEGEPFAQGDGPPLGGSFPTDRWRPGELIVSDYPVEVPSGAEPGHRRIFVGWYDWRTGEPLATRDGSILLPAGDLRVTR
jgi:hypothetical protein